MKIINDGETIVISREDFANILVMIDYIGVQDGEGNSDLCVSNIEEKTSIPKEKIKEYIDFISEINDTNNYKIDLSKRNYVRW